jgi:uncharacterized RDD family membrane protein YckC
MAGPPRDVNPYAPPLLGSEHSPSEQPRYGAGPPADRGTRLIAYLIDSLLFALVAAPGFIGLIAIGDANGLAAKRSSELLLLGSVFGPLLLLASYQWYLVATTGQSLAKRWFKIRVVRLDGSAPGFLRGVLLRSWITAAFNSVCSPAFFFVDALMVFGEESRCLHDRIASTKVIKA